MDQVVNLARTLIAHHTGAPPMILKVATTPAPVFSEGGAIAVPQKIETYVLLSVLPPDLQQHIVTAIQCLQAGR